MVSRIAIIGAGLAGSECALQLASSGVAVDLFEMRPGHSTPVHKSALPAELVCSNSFKSMVLPSAAATLKVELESLGSALLALAKAHQVSAGKALAVDRWAFAEAVGAALKAQPQINYIEQEITTLAGFKDYDGIVVASGPLTSESLATQIASLLGQDNLHFFDAAAPIVSAESLDLGLFFAASRGQADSADYLNLALDREQYLAFHRDLIAAETVPLRDFEEKYFQACQPIEVVAKSGLDALRFGALKPVGLIDPKSGRRPYAVIQLRAETPERTAFNLVGFQTNLTFAAQRQLIHSLPGMTTAEFQRYGVMHANVFVNAPLLAKLVATYRPRLYFAGQITGTEGYSEAIASGLYCALKILHSDFELPLETTFGSLLHYAESADPAHYQPMHVNYGLLGAYAPLQPPCKRRRERYQAYSDRAIAKARELAAKWELQPYVC